jgi:hypothetical protein
MRIFDFVKRQRKKIVVLPSLRNVFKEVEPWMEKAFFPIASIPLSMIRKGWKGELHILYFNEDPYNEEAFKSHNDYCSLEMISFVIESKKYSFLGHQDYFKLSEDWNQWHEMTKTSYEKLKNSNVSESDLLSKLSIGGEPEWIQNDATPHLDEEPMDFILQFSSGDFFDDMSGAEHYIFYSEKHQMVVHRYQVD